MLRRADCPTHSLKRQNERCPAVALCGDAPVARSSPCNRPWAAHGHGRSGWPVSPPRGCFCFHRLRQPGGPLQGELRRRERGKSTLNAGRRSHARQRGRSCRGPDPGVACKKWNPSCGKYRLALKMTLLHQLPTSDYSLVWG